MRVSHCALQEENLEDWMQEIMSGYGEDDYILFDCPGQIELYTHVSVFRSFAQLLKEWGWKCVHTETSFFFSLPSIVA